MSDSFNCVGCRANHFWEDWHKLSGVKEPLCVWCHSDKTVEDWETWIKQTKEDINDRDKKDKEQQNTKQENIPDSKD